MARIILFGNQKGGAGKSTLTLLCANTLAAAPFNHKVIVVDTDKQKSLVKLRLLDSEDATEPLPYDILNSNVSTFERDVKKLDKEYDFILVDVGGKLDTKNMDQERILNLIDYLFIPFVSGNFGLDATLDYLNFTLDVNKSSRKKRPFKIWGMINKFKSQSRNSRFLVSEIDDLKKVVDLPFMSNHLKDYALFSEVDTLETIYRKKSKKKNKKKSKKSDLVNFRNWFDEFYKIITT